MNTIKSLRPSLTLSLNLFITQCITAECPNIVKYLTNTLTGWILPHNSLTTNWQSSWVPYPNSATPPPTSWPPNFVPANSIILKLDLFGYLTSRVKKTTLFGFVVLRCVCVLRGTHLRKYREPRGIKLMYTWNIQYIVHSSFMLISLSSLFILHSAKKMEGYCWAFLPLHSLKFLLRFGKWNCCNLLFTVLG